MKPMCSGSVLSSAKRKAFWLGLMSFISFFLGAALSAFHNLFLDGLSMGLGLLGFGFCLSYWRLRQRIWRAENANTLRGILARSKAEASNGAIARHDLRPDSFGVDDKQEAAHGSF